MADGMSTLHRGQSEPRRDPLRQTDLLVELHAVAETDHLHLVRFSTQPCTHGGNLAGRDLQHQMGIVTDRGADLEADPAQLLRQAAVTGRGQHTHRDLHESRRRGAIDREAGAVGTPIVHDRQHLRRERTQLRTQFGGFQKQANDSAHDCTLVWPH